MKTYLLSAFLSLFLVSPALAEEKNSWLEPVIGAGYGVQVKEGRTGDDELRLIKEAGLSYVRFVIPWAEVERAKGRFVWGYFDSFVKRLRKHGLKAVIVVGGGHPMYKEIMKAPEGNMDHADTYLLAPSTDEQRTAFARYTAATIKHFGAKDIVWEIWNEPDTDRFWAPKANVEDYIKLSNEACWAMRKEEPAARIIGPGMADTPGQWGVLLPGFLGAVLKSPVADCFDAVSVHPYRDYVKPPETVGEAYKNLRQFIKAHTQEGKRQLPVLATEWGFTLSDVSEEEQAAFLLRSLLLNSLYNVPLSIWYEWRDARSGAKDPEAHFGLLNLNKEPKLSYTTLKKFLPPLVGAKIEKRIELGNKEDYILLLKQPEEKYHIVYWSADPKTDTRFIYRCGDEKQGVEVALTFMPQRASCEKGTPVVSAFHYKPNPEVEP